MRRSMCSSPGNQACWSTGMVLTYGVRHRGGHARPGARWARSSSLAMRNRARVLPLGVDHRVEAVEPLARSRPGRCPGAGGRTRRRSCALHARTGRYGPHRPRRCVHRVATVVYTDGACLGNPGPGGWAWAVPDGPFASGAADHTTNQRMEIEAALEAVRALDGPLRDRERLDLRRELLPRPVVGGLAGPGLAEQGQEAGRQPRPVGAARSSWCEERGDVTFRVGEGPQRRRDERPRRPAGGRGGRARRQGRSGDGPPGRPRARPTRRRAADAVDRRRRRCPTGHRVARRRAAAARARRLRRQPGGRRACGAGWPRSSRPRRELHPDLVVVTGLGLGAEQLGAEAAAEAGVPYVAVPALPRPRRRCGRRRRRRALPASCCDGRRRGRSPSQAQAPDVASSRPGARDRPARRVAGPHASPRRSSVWDGEDDRRRQAGRASPRRGPRCGERRTVWRASTPWEPRVEPMRVGADTGGTFTDVVADDGRGRQGAVDAGRPGAGGARRARGARRRRARRCWPTARRWPPTPCSSARGAGSRWSPPQGFADVIEIARQDRPSLYDQRRRPARAARPARAPATRSAGGSTPTAPSSSRSTRPPSRTSTRRRRGGGRLPAARRPRPGPRAGGGRGARGDGAST